MLPDSTVPASLPAVLTFLRGCFTAPTFTTFAALVTGLITQTGRGTVMGMLTGAGLTHAWSHDVPTRSSPARAGTPTCWASPRPT
ncbi:hypothetical protein [Streptomyces sp. NBC_01483]|uniref:hypothetical protein n=1 Tax=Streptomyces sp. NBC_01483 TaxID=2903883 RepID=UPI002E31F22E|nr:hypothetical protein [Streptomyces sp. NBC_01483]